MKRSVQVTGRAGCQGRPVRSKEAAVELQHLRDFVVLSEELHFGRAAERLHIAQPSLSQHVSRLERMWGGQLFDRSGHRVRLTALGALMVIQAQRILDACEQASEIARRSAAGDAGVLRIGLASGVDPGWFNGALKSLHCAFPELSLTVADMPSPQIRHSLRASRIDVGIAWMPIDASDLHITLLASEEHVAVLPVDHPLGRLAAIPMHAFDNEPVVLFPRMMSPDVYDHLSGFFRQAGAVPRVQHESFTAESNLIMTQAGLGISIIAKRYMEAISPSGIVVRPIYDPVPIIDLAMLARADEERQATRMLRALLQATTPPSRLAPVALACQPGDTFRPGQERPPGMTLAGSGQASAQAGSRSFSS